MNNPVGFSTSLSCYVCGKPATAMVSFDSAAPVRFTTTVPTPTSKPVCAEHDWTGISSSILVRKARVEALEAVVEAARAMPYSNHTAHFDPTGGSGAGCPECKRMYEARTRLNATLAALDGSAHKAGNPPEPTS